MTESVSDITVATVCKRYADVIALDGVSLNCPARSITAVIGRSGSGKSTLVKLVNGLVRPDSGRVDIFQQAVNYEALPELRRQIGYAVQGTGLFPHMTVAENITLLADVEGWERNRRHDRLVYLLDLVQLGEEFLPRFPHELSGGQQQRVGLCRAMMLNPPILLLDEPFGALDPITRNDMQQQLLRLQAAEARTTLLVTHDMREALKLADSIVVMEVGRIVMQSPAGALADQAQDMDPDQLLLSLLEGGA